MNDNTPENIIMSRSLYKEFLEPRKDVNHLLMESLTKAEIMKAGRMLGVVKENALYLGEEEMPCLCDIAFREIKRNGSSPIGQLLATGSIKNKFQKEYLSGLNQSRISLFEVVECHAENGSLKLHDLLFPEQGDILLYDIGFSSTASCEWLLFTTAVPVYDAFITSGVVFTFDVQWKDFIFREVHKGFEQQWKNSVKRFKQFFYLNRKIGNQVIFQ